MTSLAIGIRRTSIESGANGITGHPERQYIQAGPEDWNPVVGEMYGHTAVVSRALIENEAGESVPDVVLDLISLNVSDIVITR